MKRKGLIAAALLACCFVLAAQTGFFPGPDVPPNRLPSGIFGQSLVFTSPGGPTSGLVPPLISNPFQTYVTAYDQNGKWVTTIISNPVGQFYTHLRPGKYTLLATVPGDRRPPRDFKQYVPTYFSGYLSSTPTNITVVAHQFTQVNVSYVMPNNHY